MTHRAAADGPGRCYHLAETVSSLDSRMVTLGGDPMFIISTSFEDIAPGQAIGVMHYLALQYCCLGDYSGGAKW